MLSYMKRIGVCLPAFIITFMYGIGYFADVILIKELHLSMAEKIIILGIALISFLIICRGISYLYKKINTLCVRNKDNSENIYIKTKDVISCSLKFFLCYIPYLILRFPGHVDIDTYWELIEMYRLDAFKDHHPFFDTVFFGLFWRIGDSLGSNLYSVLIYALLQSLCVAIVFSITHIYMKQNGVPKVVSSVAFIFMAFYPAIPMMAQTMTKDTLHAWILALFYLGYIETIRTSGENVKNLRFDMAGILVMLLLFLTKKTGVYVVMVSMIFLAIIIKNRTRLILITVTALLLYGVIWQGLVLTSLGVKSGESREMMSVPSQQVAALLRYDADRLTEKDYEILNGVYSNLKSIRDNYSPTRADNTKALWREDSTQEEKAAFFRWYLIQWIKSPKYMLYAFAANGYGVFALDQDSLGNESCIFYQDNMPTVDRADEFDEMLASWSDYDIKKEDVHMVLGTSYRPIWANKISWAFDKIYLNIASVFTILFSKVLYATWIPLLALGYGIYQKNMKLFVACVPVGMLTAMILAGPIVLPRYMASTLFIIPMTVAMPFILRGGKDK